MWSVRKQDIMCVRLFNFGHNEHCRALRQHDERRIHAASAASANGEAFRHAVVASHRVSRGAAGSLRNLATDLPLAFSCVMRTVQLAAAALDGRLSVAMKCRS